MECKLFFAGDVVLGNDVLRGAVLAENFIREIEDCDIKCCNLEAPIKNISLYPQRKIGPNNSNSEQSISALKKTGFNLVTLANNHIFDYGCFLSSTFP